VVFSEILGGALQRPRLDVVTSPLKTLSRFRKNPIAGIAVLALFTLLLSSCGGGGTVTETGSDNPPPPPPPPPQNHFAISTYHNDNSRSGINSQETTLTPANVNMISFGRLAAVPVQGAIYAQPLYIADVTMSDGKNHNLVIVVTEHDQVYAIDAATYQVMWNRSFLDSQGSIMPGSGTDFPCGESFNPEVGITGTPVIDSSSATVYLVAVTKNSQSGQAQYYQTLYALRLTDGQNASTPTVITSPSGSEYGSATFDPLMSFQRAALLLVNGNVYVSWASQCEAHAGWLMSFSATTLQPTGAWTPDPSGLLGGIWMGGGGPSADSNGNVFLAVANGWSDAQTGGSNYGDSVVRLNPTGNQIEVADYFMPYDYDKLYNDDLDLGSGTPVLLPTQTGAAHPNMLITGGKEGTIYLLNRDNLGKYQPDNNDQILQSFQIQGTGVFVAPVFWNNTLYYGLSGFPLQAFAYDPSTQMINTTPISTSPTNMAYPGVSPSLTSNNGNDAVLWAVETPHANAVLRAYDPTNLTTELYDSEMSSDRDHAGEALRFTVPTVANGEVFVGTRDELDIYGELPQ
jgi:hypothetical protein